MVSVRWNSVGRNPDLTEEVRVSTPTSDLTLGSGSAKAAAKESFQVSGGIRST
jgi:hypothetical protein